MTRPFMSCNIVQLEELFVTSSGDESDLKQLEGELAYRKVPRAVALLDRVRAALYLGRSAAAPTQKTAISSTLSQPGLWTSKTVSLLQATTQNTRPQLPPNQATLKPTREFVPPNAPTPKIACAQPDLSMSVEEAYKVLKATPSSTWEAIELSRRQIVQQAHPDNLARMGAANQMQAKVSALRANSAYAVLCGANGN